MRRIVATLGALSMMLVAAVPAAALPSTGALAKLQGKLSREMRLAGSYSGALVVDLTNGHTVYSHAAGTGREPASVEKLYTTSTALARYGPAATLSTNLLATGSLDAQGTWQGNLYLQGGGDPTFGSAAFDAANYRTGATVEDLAGNLLTTVGMIALHGQIVGDESRFDSLRGTPPYGYSFNQDEEGSLSALAFNRDVNKSWTVAQPHPALYAARQLASVLSGQGLDLSGASARAGRTPAGAHLLASVSSPPMSTLVALTDAPSDNFFAETLLKDLGASFGSGGTTAAGAAVVRAQLARWGIHPALEDGSGLSRGDRTSPGQVVRLLQLQATDTPFLNALAVAGRSGTLSDRMAHTAAAGRCQAKTGTLSDVSNLAGYCRARDGHLFAFALLMNGVIPMAAHPLQDAIAESLAAYTG